MKILLIGGTGLISTSVTKRLLALGHEVTHFNRGQTASINALPGVRSIKGDRRDFAAFESQIQAGENWDCVMDMICFTPTEAASLARAFKGKTVQLILTSTVDVYARPQPAYPIREEAPRGGVSAYGKAKVECEDIIVAASAHGDFAVTIIRPVQTVNDHGRFHTSVGKADLRLFDRYRKGLPIIVHGDGSSLWTICHADDVAVAYAGAVGNSRAFGRAYHLPGPETITWDDFHRRAAAAIGAAQPQLLHIPTDVLSRISPERASISVENFQFNNAFDSSAARADLGFAPKTFFEECVGRIYSHAQASNLIEPAESDVEYTRILECWARASQALSSRDAS